MSASQDFQTDGHRYIPMALEKGAAALLVEHAVEDVPQNITVIQTENNRQALATLSANFYDHPTQKMRVTGVTALTAKPPSPIWCVLCWNG